MCPYLREYTQLQGTVNDVKTDARVFVFLLRSLLEDILLTFFRNADKQVALKYLKHLAFLRRDPSLHAQVMHRGVAFGAGSNGGAIITFRPDVRLGEKLGLLVCIMGITLKFVHRFEDAIFWVARFLFVT